MKKLELHKETLRDLTDVELAEVAGGAATTKCGGQPTQTMACPSGATWFTECESYQILCV